MFTHSGNAEDTTCLYIPQKEFTSLRLFSDVTSWRRRDFVRYGAAAATASTTLLSGCLSWMDTVDVEVHNEATTQHRVEITALSESGEELFTKTSRLEPEESVNYDNVLPSFDPENPYYVTATLENGTTARADPEMSAMTAVWFTIRSAEEMVGGREAP